MTCDNCFDIPVGTEVGMIFAFQSSKNLVYHDNYRGNFDFTLAVDGTCSTSAAAGPSKTPNKHFQCHGYMMWISWTLISMLQLWTNRYWVHHWKWRQPLHSVLGILAGILSLIAGIIAIKNTGGWYFDYLHNASGIVFYFLTILLVLGGIVTLLNRKYLAKPWQTKSMLMGTKVHKYFGYLIIITVQIAVCSGISRYNHIFGAASQPARFGLIFGNLAIVIIGFMIMETRHQIFTRKHVTFTRKNTNLDRTEFTEMLKNGRKLVLLDDLVLDIADFIETHPGGKFVL